VIWEWVCCDPESEFYEIEWEIGGKNVPETTRYLSTIGMKYITLRRKIECENEMMRLLLLCHDVG
jgi:hypothetical protein